MDTIVFDGSLADLQRKEAGKGLKKDEKGIPTWEKDLRTDVGELVKEFEDTGKLLLNILKEGDELERRYKEQQQKLNDMQKRMEGGE